MDICFLTCICLWQISQIQTFLFRVVVPGLVSTSPAFVSNSASHPAGPHDRHAQKTVNRGGSTQFAQQLDFAVTAPPLVGCVVWSLEVTYCHLHPGIGALLWALHIGLSRSSAQLRKLWRLSCFPPSTPTFSHPLTNTDTNPDTIPLLHCYN